MMSSLEHSARRSPFPESISSLEISLDIQTIGHVLSYLANNFIDLKNIKKCRNKDWGKRKKSSYIESLIIGLPTPPFYLNLRAPEYWSIIDGYQRLITLKSFIIENAFPLYKLELIREFDGMYYHDLPNSVKRRILESPAIIQKITEVNNPVIMNSFYRRIISGNSGHTELEIAFSYATNNTWQFLEDIVPHINELFENKQNGLKQYANIICFFDILMTGKESIQAYDKIHPQDISKTLFYLNNASKSYLNELKEAFLQAIAEYRYLFNNQPLDRIVKEQFLSLPHNTNYVQILLALPSQDRNLQRLNRKN